MVVSGTPPPFSFGSALLICSDISVAQQPLGCRQRHGHDGQNGTHWAFFTGTINPRTHSQLHHFPAAIFLSSHAPSSLQLCSTQHSGVESSPLLSEKSGPFSCLLMDSRQLTGRTCGYINVAGRARSNMYPNVHGRDSPEISFFERSLS